MSLYLFLIGVILVIALVVIITILVSYQRYSFDCYHQASPQCFLDWECPTSTCTRDQINAGNACGKFRICTPAEIMSEICPFPAQVTRFTADQTGRCVTPGQTCPPVLGPGGRNICKTAWPFLPTTVNTVLPVIL